MHSGIGRLLTDFGELSPAEKALLEACARGSEALVGTTAPGVRCDTNTIRASFVEFLVLGGDGVAPIHHAGINLRGAWIHGQLNLAGAVIQCNIAASGCRFDAPPDFTNCTLGNLDLNSCLVDGLILDGVVTRGDIFLSRLRAHGTVRLLGARIGGDFDLEAAQIISNGGDALLADRIEVGGHALLTSLDATGEVRLLGAQIQGNLVCRAARFSSDGGDAFSIDGCVVRGDVFLDKASCAGHLRLMGASIAGDLECRELDMPEGARGEFIADGAVVSGTWTLLGLKWPIVARLQRCRVGQLVDAQSSWRSALALDGFEYGRLGSPASVAATARVGWLNLQSDDDLAIGTEKRYFKPQPWRYLQRVLQETGHTEEARQVAIAFEDHIRRAGLLGQSPESWAAPRRIVYRQAIVCLHWTFRVLIGYGYRPLRLIGWLAIAWLVGATLYWYAAAQGVMGPTNPLIFNNPKLATECRANWYVCSTLPEEYSGFSPLAYSLDLLLPFVDLGQEKEWAPLIPTPRLNWWSELFHWSLKHCVRVVVWMQILFGWVASLLLVAVFSGLLKRRDE